MSVASTRLLSPPQSNAYLIGLSGIVLIVGGRFLYDDLNAEVRSTLTASGLFRFFVVFSIIFLNTKNLMLAIVSGTIYTTIFWYRDRRKKSSYL